MPQPPHDAAERTLGVILTNYNHGSVVGKALRAITQQERHPDQLVIVDDGSRDNSLAAIEPFLNDPRVSLIRKAQNEGLAAAVASGFDALRTDFVYFAAADDHVLPGFFQHAGKAIAQHPDCGMVFGRLLSVRDGVYMRMGLFDGGTRDRSGLLTPNDFFKHYFSRFGSMMNMSPATIHRRSALDAIGYRKLLREFDFVLDSFVIQVLGGMFPSYYIDADCAQWTWDIEGGALRFFADQRRIEKFARSATEHLRREPYGQVLSADHFGLYLYGVWFRAITAGYPFDPQEFAGVRRPMEERVAQEKPLTEPLPGGPTVQGTHGARVIPEVMRDAYAVLSAGMARIDLESRPLRRAEQRALLKLPMIAVMASRLIHRLFKRVSKPSRTVRRTLRIGKPSKATRDSEKESAPVVIVSRERRTLSALICNYNDGRHITSAIEAVLSQTRQPDELLIMDDASSDDSVSVVERYVAKHPWIRLFRSDVNRGYIGGISELTRYARGDFIHRGTSDDYMRPEFVAKVMHMAEQYPESGIVSSALLVLNDQSEERIVLDVPGWQSGFKSAEQFLHEYLEHSDPVATLAPSTIFRRQVVAELGGWREELDTWDVSFVLQAAGLKYGMAYVNDPEYVWTYRGGRWTQTSNRNTERANEICGRYFRLMRSPEYRQLFGEKFPPSWLHANLKNIALSASEATFENFLRGASVA